jgi:predicted O-methyltransferase YrrM
LPAGGYGAAVRESAFTAPHAGCPRPELWNAPDSDSTEVEVSELVGALVRALQPELVVETGTAYGYTAVRIGLALMRNGHGRCVSLETDGARAAHARHRLLETGVLPAVVEVREQSSLDYEPEDKIGFAWFDSLYELRVDEFLRYYALGCLPAGTIVGFHDTTSGLRQHHLDVRAEIDNRLANRVTALYLPTPRGVGLCQVR